MLSHITLVYPHGDKVNLEYAVGSTILEVAKNFGMDSKYRKTCIVQIKSKGLLPPTQEEKRAFTPKKLEDGYRYADTYHLSAEDNGAEIHLQIVRITYTNSHNVDINVVAYDGENMTNLVHRTEAIDLPFACDGRMSCSTCYCILDKNTFEKLGEPEPDEAEMLVVSRHFGRIGCQIDFTKKVDKCHIMHPRSAKSKS
jgi:ferredoxin